VIQDAPQIITMEDSPAQAVKAKPNSSIVVGLGLHAKGYSDAFVSAGHTGALLAASAFILGRLEGVLRPTIASYFPTVKGFRLLVDAGANLEVKPEFLFQFAIMGGIFAQHFFDIAEPKIGLMNVGEEKEKGTEVIRAAHKLLEQLPNFVGNIEGRDVIPGHADVFVCDGLVGNILLKFGESIGSELGPLFKQSMVEMQLDPSQMQMVGKAIKNAFTPFDYQNVGGVPFLGVNGVSLVGHGKSTPLAIKNMIFNAVKMVEAKINDKIVAALATDRAN
jgi:glycerol-3-phosphate acyltransferase PlsX